jgi:tetratricopeptide (TPR) repeat protein
MRKELQMNNDEYYQELSVGNSRQIISELEAKNLTGDQKSILALAYAIEENKGKFETIVSSICEEDLEGIGRAAYYNAISIDAYHKKDYEKAIIFADRTQLVVASDFFAFKTKGIIYTAEKKYSEALICFKHILDIYTESESIKYACILIYRLQHDQQSALKVNATIKPSLKKSIDLIVILLFGNQVSSFLCALFIILVLAIPQIRLIAFVLLSLASLILITLSIRAKHVTAITSFFMLELGIVLVYFLCRFLF